MTAVKGAPRSRGAKRRKGAERTEELVEAMRRWQAVEREAIDTCAALMERTDNGLVRQVLEIIRGDSVQHHRVQQFVIDSLTKSPVRMSPDELSEVWGEIEKHDAVEREVIALGKKLRDECTFPAQRMLLDYLIADEEKHDVLLRELGEFKTKLYPYA